MLFDSLLFGGGSIAVRMLVTRQGLKSIELQVPRRKWVDSILGCWQDRFTMLRDDGGTNRQELFDLLLRKGATAEEWQQRTAALHLVFGIPF